MATTTTLTPTAAPRGGVDLSRVAVSRGLLALVALLVGTALGLLGAYTRAPEFVIGAADSRTALHFVGFHDPEATGQTNKLAYRWTMQHSTIRVPGIGRGLWSADITASSPQPAGQPKRAMIGAGDSTTVVQLQPAARTLHLLTPSSGDIDIVFDAPAARYGADPRQLGIVFFGAQLQPLVVAALPPVPLLLEITLAIMLAFLTLRLIGVPPWTAAAPALASLALIVWLAAAYRIEAGVYAIRILALAVVGLLVIASTRWAVPRLYRRGAIEITPNALRLLLLIVYGSFVVKAAGLLWPYFTAIDIEWHMEKSQRVLNGQIWQLWDANSSFHQSVMPTTWGTDKPVIPYSPFYHIFSAVWAIFPWKLETSANIFSTILDAVRPLMIFFIVRRFGFRERAALIGALTYSLIPATFLLHIWGNTPTTTGMWWSLLSITLLVGTWESLHRFRWAWAALTAALTATMLFYAVTAVFTTLLLLFACGMLLLARRSRDAWPIFISLAAAILLSTGIYYWQFVGPILQRTLPRLTGAVEPGGQALGVVPVTPGQFVWSYVYMLDIYGMYLPLALGLAGWWIGLRRLGMRSPFAAVMTAWLVVAMLFWIIAFRVDMVDKQLFWLMPWMGICTGIAADRLLDHRRARSWTGLILLLCALYVGSDALYLWIHRLHGYRNDLAFTSWFQLLRKMML